MDKTPASPRRRELVAKYGAERRFHPDQDHTKLRREIAAQKLEDSVRDIVANWPPLSPVQLDRIAALLRQGGEAK